MLTKFVEGLQATHEAHVAFGVSLGVKATGLRGEVARDELVAALVALQEGEADRARRAAVAETDADGDSEAVGAKRRELRESIDALEALRAEVRATHHATHAHTRDARTTTHRTAPHRTARRAQSGLSPTPPSAHLSPRLHPPASTQTEELDPPGELRAEVLEKDKKLAEKLAEVDGKSEGGKESGKGSGKGKAAEFLLSEMLPDTLDAIHAEARAASRPWRALTPRALIPRASASAGPSHPVYSRLAAPLAARLLHAVLGGGFPSSLRLLFSPAHTLAPRPRVHSRRPPRRLPPCRLAPRSLPAAQRGGAGEQ